MEESFGIIPLRQTDGRTETFIVHHRKGHWGFPKGHAELGETPREAAARELLEETGLTVVRLLSSEPLYDHYTYEKGKKRVTYFVAEVSGEVLLQQAEIQEGKWLPLEEAREQLTFPGSKELLVQVSEYL